MGKKTVLVVGFNTRPLAESLNKSGYDVYAVDFFGDLDLYPNVKDCLVVTKNLDKNYNLIKDNFGQYLAKFTINLLRKYANVKYLIIGSGLDDAFKEREAISNEIKKNNYKILSANNDLNIIRKARDIENIYDFLSSQGYDFPSTDSFNIMESSSEKFRFPFILKKKTGSGGINVFKIENESDLHFFIKKNNRKRINSSNWLIQEYIEGLPVSCTIISNGKECEIISINRQILGLKSLNAPKEFMYCGNVVPANLLKNDNKLISQISRTLTIELGLRGINGFDFVLKNHYPYLMEINPRIPGSIGASESALGLNLLDLHIKSFNLSNWEKIKSLIKSTTPKKFATKLIMFAPKKIDKYLVTQINHLNYIHDKSEPRDILEGEPLCTILYNGLNLSESYFGALKIVDDIKNILG
ncbi:MAG: ATP-grasp domain-containing protein [Promethearchaeota archaeon]